jgi:hypothetical protein
VRPLFSPPSRQQAAPENGCGAQDGADSSGALATAAYFHSDLSPYEQLASAGGLGGGGGSRLARASSGPRAPRPGSASRSYRLAPGPMWAGQGVVIPANGIRVACVLRIAPLLIVSPVGFAETARPLASFGRNARTSYLRKPSARWKARGLVLVPANGAPPRPPLALAGGWKTRSPNGRTASRILSTLWRRQATRASRWKR